MGEKIRINSEPDYGAMSDQALLRQAADPNATPEERKDAFDTVIAREKYGVFNQERPAEPVIEDFDSRLNTVIGYTGDLEDANPSRERISRTRSRNIGNTARHEADRAATLTERDEAGSGAIRELLPRKYKTPGLTALNESAKSEYLHRRKDLAERPEFNKEAYWANKELWRETGTNETASQGSVEEQPYDTTERPEVRDGSNQNKDRNLEKLQIKDAELAGQIKNKLLKDRRMLRQVYLNSSLRHLAKGHFATRTSKLISEGYNELYGDDLIDKLESTETEEIKEARAAKIERAAADRVASERGWEYFIPFDRAALRAATKRGVTVEIDPATNEERRTFALPIHKKELVPPSNKKYKNEDPLLFYMQVKGFDPKSDDIRDISYEGFYNIVDAIKNDPEPSMKELDWYFDNFGYAEHYEEFYDKVKGLADGNEKAIELIDKYDYYKLDELTRPENKSQICDLDNCVVARGNDLYITDMSNLENAVKECTSFLNVKLLNGEFFPPKKRERGTTIVDDPKPRPTPELSNNRWGAIYGAFCFIKMYVDGNVDIWAPPIKARKMLRESKKMAGINNQVSSQVAEGDNDTIVRNASTDHYAVLRFGANGKNYAIAECTSPNDGRTFFWQGSAENSRNEDWQKAFQYDRATLVKMIHNSDPLVAGTGEQIHRGVNSESQMVRILKQLLSPNDTFEAEDTVRKLIKIATNLRLEAKQSA